MARRLLLASNSVLLEDSGETNLGKTRNTRLPQKPAHLCNGDNKTTIKSNNTNTREYDLLENQLLEADSELILCMENFDTKGETDLRVKITNLKKRMEKLTVSETETVAIKSVNITGGKRQRPKNKRVKNVFRRKQRATAKTVIFSNTSTASVSPNKNVTVLQDGDRARDRICDDNAAKKYSRKNFGQNLKIFSGTIHEFGQKEGEMDNFINLGLSYNLEKDNEKSLECFENALDISYFLNFLDKKIKILYECFQIYFEMELYENALNYIQEYTQIVNEKSYLCGQCKGYKGLSDCYMKLEKYDEAKNCNDKYLEFEQSFKKLYDITENPEYFHHRNKMIAEQEKSIGKIIDDTNKSRSLYNTGLIKYEEEEFESAIFYLQESLSFTHPIYNEHTQQLIYFQLVLAYIYQAKKFTNELTYVNKSEIIALLDFAKSYQLKIINPDNNFIESMFIYGEIGDIFASIEDDSNAIDYFNKQLALSKEKNNYLHQIKVLGKIGDIHISKKRWEEALCFYYESYETCELVDDPLCCINACRIIISIHYEAKNYSKTITYGKICLELSSKVNNKIGLCDAYHFMMIASKEANQLDNALKFGNMLLDVARRFNDDELLQKTKHDIDEISKEINRKRARSLRFWAKN